MTDLGELKEISLRDVWNKEATDFSPWLAKNIRTLGDVLGMDLEVIEREAPVGNFSLDIKAEDINTKKTVVIENQLTLTDHDHLGKLLTYAAGLNASVVVWVSDTVRDEHRQVFEWLNQKTDSETQFFAVEVKIIKIDDSKPACQFKLIVSPNEWQKSIKKSANNVSEKGEKYKNYYQELIDDINKNYPKFTGARKSQPQNWFSFSSGINGISYSAVFPQGNMARTEVYIGMADREQNKNLFDTLMDNKGKIEKSMGETLKWERLDDKTASRISVYRKGTIDSPESELEEIRKWHIDNLMKIKEVFTPEITRINQGQR